MSIRTFVNTEETVMVQLMAIGPFEVSTVHVATRDHPDQIWSPPIVLREERS